MWWATKDCTAQGSGFIASACKGTSANTTQKLMKFAFDFVGVMLP